MTEEAQAQGARFLEGLQNLRTNNIREVGGILAKDTYGHTIRIAPPLVITAEQVDWALERIEGALRQEMG